DGRDVPLGRIYIDKAPALGNRRYASLRGEMVTAASGSARLQIGTDEQDLRMRFAIGLPQPGGNFNSCLYIDSNGDTSLQGKTTLHNAALRIDTPIGLSLPVGDFCERQPDWDNLERQAPV